MTKGELFLRSLSGVSIDQITVLDAFGDTVNADPEAGPTSHTVFFSRGTTDEALMSAFGDGIQPVMRQGGSPVLKLDKLPDGVIPNPEEHNLLAGHNVLLATRNGESVEAVLDWLIFHYDYFGADGAIIFNRSPRGSDENFLRRLGNKLRRSKRPITVVMVEASIPLGDPERPPEQHPFCVSEAPGRDRMEVPPSDPWLSPLHEFSVYEIARQRFLRDARACCNLDICDLLYDPVVEEGAPDRARVGVTPFDKAVNAPDGYVQLLGRHCYPWRVRKTMDPSFSDHICVQFDKPKSRVRWCYAPEKLRPEQTLKVRRISNASAHAVAPFYRYMALRHPVHQPSNIVPKSSLVESEKLINISKNVFGFKPVRAPEIKARSRSSGKERTTIVTTMKNEGPFILEWIAYHQAIGCNGFLVYTNDCTDGTDDMFDLLQSKGIVQHRQNPFRELNLKPQHAALQAAEDEKIIKQADWLICMDVDEFLNIKIGNGTLPELYEAVGEANMISCTWRLFGNSDLHEFKDEYTIGMFSHCAHEFAPKPHQAWGFKTLYRNSGIFKKMGVHRPKGLHPQRWDEIHWVNGSGKHLPKTEFRNAWRSTSTTYGYDLVSLNHYAVRNAESFLVKRDRGRVNHVDRDQGLAYWFRMNNNATEERSIQRRIPMMEEKLAALMSDPDIARQHQLCVDAHRRKIDELKSVEAQMAFFDTLTGTRMEKLSRMHQYFGANIFLAGPESVPDDVVWGEHPEGFQFTVERTETQH